MTIKSINKKLPKVTICVPVRNGARTIQRTLDSLLNQDYPNCEIIVSDNCSDDDTAKIVSQYSSNGVKYFFNPVLEKSGEANWNHILTLAEGPLIALYHADDIYTPTMVRLQVELLQEHPEISAAFTMSMMIDEHNRLVRAGCLAMPAEYRGKTIYEFPDLFNAVLKHCTITSVPTMMTRKSVLDKVGNFNWQRFCSAADIDLYFRMARIGPIGIIDEPLHHYRLSEQQWSAQIRRMRVEMADFFRVLNDYLTRPEVVQIVDSDAFAYYEMNLAIDDVFCAMNLLVQGDTMKAQARLKESLEWRHFRTACRRPLRLARLIGGAGLLVMGSLGAGALAGRCFYWAYQLLYRWRRQCIT